MAGRVALTRKAFFVDEKAVRRARRALHVGSDAEAIRAALDQVADMERFWRFIAKSRGRLEPGSIEAP